MLLANTQGRQSGIIVERSVADETENGPLGKSRFDSQSSARAGAEAADATGKKRARLQHIQVAMDRKPMRDGFFHHESIRREDLCELIGDPACVNGFLSAANGRLFFPRDLSFFVTAAPSLCAPRRVDVTLGDSLLDRF